MIKLETWNVFQYQTPVEDTMKSIWNFWEKTNSEYITMSETSLKIGNKICIKTTERLLASSLTLLENSSNLDHALGLYTFALEEFGKAVLLKEIIDDKTNPKQVPKEIFGSGKRSAHNIKFKKAIEILPKDCISIWVGESITIPSGKDAKQSLGKIKGTFTVAANTTGTFLTTVLMNFAVRMRCFYVDWDENSEYWHKWKANLQTDRDSLKNAINEFKKIIPKYDFTKL